MIPPALGLPCAPGVGMMMLAATTAARTATSATIMDFIAATSRCSWMTRSTMADAWRGRAHARSESALRVLPDLLGVCFAGVESVFRENGASG
jgi:hypothetical protein